MVHFRVERGVFPGRGGKPGRKSLSQVIEYANWSGLYNWRSFGEFTCKKMLD